MKKARMNISHSRFILSKLKIFGEIVTTLLLLGSDYFTENFQLRENKTRMRNIHPRFFHLLF